jgi:hypothetical protein
MSGTQPVDYQQRFPATDFTVADVTHALATDGEIVSVRGRRGAPNVFVVKFATPTGSIGPLILNQMSAQMLKKLLHQEGF